MRKDEQFAAGARSDADWVGVRPVRPPAADPRIMRVYPPARDPRVGPVIDPRDFAPGLRAGSGDGSPRFSDGGSGGPALDAPESVNLDALAELLRRLADIPAIHDFIASGALDDIPGYEGIGSWDDLLTVTGFGGAAERGFDALGGAGYGGRAGQRDRDAGGFGVSRLGLVSDGPRTGARHGAGVPGPGVWIGIYGEQQPKQPYGGTPQEYGGVPDSWLRHPGDGGGGLDAGTGGPDAPDGGTDAPDSWGVPESGTGGDAATRGTRLDDVTATYVDAEGNQVVEHNGGSSVPGGWTVTSTADPEIFVVQQGPSENPNPDGNATVAELAALHRLLGYFHPATFWGRKSATNPRRVRPDRETAPNPWGPRLVVPGLADEPSKLRARASGARPLTRGEFQRGMWGGGGPRPIDPTRALMFLAEALKARL